MREHGYTDIAVLMLMRYKFLLNWELGDAGLRRFPPRMLRTRRESGIGKNPMYLTDTRIAISLLLTPFPLKKYLFFLQTTEETEGTPGKEKIGNFGAGRE